MFLLTVKAETGSFARPLPFTMVVLSPPTLPFAVPSTSALLKWTVPKLVSGRMPVDEQGASAMTSAEARVALARVFLIVCDQPLVVSFSTRVKWPLPVKVTDPVKWSPGLTGLEKFTGNAGYISYQE